jgi:hypothetical protein
MVKIKITQTGQLWWFMPVIPPAIWEEDLRSGWAKVRDPI